MKEIIEKINLYREAEASLANVNTLRADLYKKIYELKKEIADYFVENMLGKVNLEGVGEVQANFDPKYEILGGEFKAPEKKLELFRELESMGYGDKIKFYETGAINKTSFNAIMKKLDAETIKGFKDRGLISVYTEPTIKIK